MKVCTFSICIKMQVEEPVQFSHFKCDKMLNGRKIVANNNSNRKFLKHLELNIYCQKLLRQYNTAMLSSWMSAS